MRVRQLIGIYVGQIIEVPYHVAQRCMNAQPPTMCIPGKEPKIRGMVLVDPEPEVQPAPPAPAKRLKRKYRRRA